MLKTEEAIMFSKRVLALPAMTALLSVAWGNAQAHTRFEIAATNEGVRTDNNVMVPHGCSEKPVIGQALVFPQVSTALVDASPDANAAVTAASFARVDAPASNFISPIKVAGIRSRDSFEINELIFDDANNPIGAWWAGGQIPASNWVGKQPMRINAISIVPASCARKVIVVPAIANVCEVTSLNAINGKDPDGTTNVDLWTAPDAGHPNYDGAAWNYPAPYTVNRNLETNPLPANCGEGIAVRIYPSAAQLDRDMPVKYNGEQIWPKP
jgi:hypothetical protein